MEYSALAAFWIVSVLLVVTPGMDWAYVISAGMRGKAVVPAVSGLLAGHMAAILLVAAGVGALLASTPGALDVLAIAGAAYLFWIGVGQLRHPSGPLAAGEAEESRSGVRWALKGACVSGLNPKVLLLFLVLLPQFVRREAAWAVPLQIVALGLLHVFTCGVVYLALGFSARAVLRTRPRVAGLVSRASGAAMVAIAVLLFLEHAA